MILEQPSREPPRGRLVLIHVCGGAYQPDGGLTSPIASYLRVRKKQPAFRPPGPHQGKPLFAQRRLAGDLPGFRQRQTSQQASARSPRLPDQRPQTSILIHWGGRERMVVRSERWTRKEVSEHVLRASEFFLVAKRSTYTCAPWFELQACMNTTSSFRRRGHNFRPPQSTHPMPNRGGGRKQCLAREAHSQGTRELTPLGASTAEHR